MQIIKNENPEKNVLGRKIPRNHRLYGQTLLKDSVLISEKELPVQRLLENQVLFFASDETGDPVYKNIALKSSDLIIDRYFSDLQSIKSIVNYNDLAIGLYGCSYLYSKTGIEKYKGLSQNIASVLTLNFELPENSASEDLKHFSNNKSDLITESLVCLGLFDIGNQSENQYKKSSEIIYNNILDSIENSEKSTNEVLSFKLFYYLFEYERLKQIGEFAAKSTAVQFYKKC